MGCSSAKEKLENEMMKIQIRRLEIQMEKFNELEKLSKIEKHKIRPRIIPDYIDPKFAKEHKIYINNNIENKTDFTKEKKPKVVRKRNSTKSKSKTKIN